MANDDKNKDKEQDDFFGDDEDFGLPELDYEALDDDDSSDTEKTASEETPAEPEEETVEASSDDDSVFDSDSMDDMDDMDMEDIGDMDDIDMDDLGDMEGMEDEDDEEIPDQISDEELAASMKEETSDEAETEDVDDFYEEESFDDFDASGDDDDMDDISDSVFDSDVLDEDEFAQFEKELMETEEDMSDMTSFESDDTDAPAQSKGKFAKVVIFGVIIFASLGAAFWFLSPMGGGEEGEKKPVAEKTTKPETEKPAETTPEETTEETPKEAENNTQTQAAKPANNQPKTTPAAKKPAATKPKAVASNPGTVNELTDRTGNMYIIIGSFLDRDMAIDFANELSAAGKSPSVIPPFGKAVTHRVAIAGYGSLAEAQRAIDGFKSEFGNDIWILRY
ncbi:MAG: SPOR domain-containing protein [Ekhidna sp.]|uniref:SPOR domain-containing protein n=1 Tax=Ekhidna sp. TaxID=2608089 RepID=UPI0032F0564B